MSLGERAERRVPQVTCGAVDPAPTVSARDHRALPMRHVHARLAVAIFIVSATVLGGCRTTCGPTCPCALRIPAPKDAVVNAVETRELRLTNVQGQVIARLASNECGEASLSMYAAHCPDTARLRVELSVFGTPVTTLVDAWKHESLRLTLEGDEPGEPAITLSRKPRASAATTVRVRIGFQNKPEIVFERNGTTVVVPIADVLAVASTN